MYSRKYRQLHQLFFEVHSSFALLENERETHEPTFEPAHSLTLAQGRIFPDTWAQGIVPNLQIQFYNAIEKIDKEFNRVPSKSKHYEDQIDKRCYFNLLSLFIQLSIQLNTTNKKDHAKFKTQRQLSDTAELIPYRKLFKEKFNQLFTNDIASPSEYAFSAINLILRNFPSLENLQGISDSVFDYQSLSLPVANEKILIHIYDEYKTCQELEEKKQLKCMLLYGIAEKALSDDEDEDGEALDKKKFSLFQCMDSYLSTKNEKALEDLIRRNLKISDVFTLDDYIEYFMADIKRQDETRHVHQYSKAHRKFFSTLCQYQKENPNQKEYVKLLHQYYLNLYHQGYDYKCSAIAKYLHELQSLQNNVTSLQAQSKNSNCDRQKLHDTAKIIEDRATKLQGYVTDLFGVKPHDPRELRLKQLSFIVMGTLLISVGALLTIPLTPLIGVPLMSVGGGCLFLGFTGGITLGTALTAYGIFPKKSLNTRFHEQINSIHKQCKEVDKKLHTDYLPFSPPFKR